MSALHPRLPARYSETIQAPGWTRGVGLVCLVGAVALLVLGVLDRVIIFSDASGIIGFCVGLLALLLVSATFLLMNIRIVITSTQLELALQPIFRRRFAVRGLQEVVASTVSPQDFGGIGYRVWGKERAFLLNAGPAVSFIDGPTGRKYFCRSDDLSTLVAALTSARGISED